MKNNIRIILYGVAAGLSFMLWQKWQYVNQTVNTSAAITQSAPVTSTASQASSTVPPSADTSTATQNVEASAGQVTVSTDVMRVVIDLQGTTITQVDLLKYPEKVGDSKPLSVMHINNPGRSLLQSGINGSEANTVPTPFSNWTAEKQDYRLADGVDELPVTFTWKNDAGVVIQKTFTFRRGEYQFSLVQRIDNKSSQVWQGSPYTRIVYGQAAPSSSVGSAAGFTGGVLSTPNNHYQKIKLKDITKARADVSAEDGWVAMMQHYFISAIVPKSDSVSYFYTAYEGKNDDHIIGTRSDIVNINPNQSHTFTDTVYIGPKIAKNLESTAPYLDKTIDYGILFIISEFMFKILSVIHSVINNWGWAIVLMTILIKLIFFFPSAWAYKSMAKMRALQPKMAALKERYGEDRQAMSQAMMKLYRDNKVNPASGCLPMLMQIPFFIAFYEVLAESVQLRHASWIGWIKDLSAMDPYYILPIVNTALMFIQQRLNPPPSDPMQARVMMLLPLIFGFLFMWFPSGLVLYWTVSNAFSIVQQYIMNKRYGSGAVGRSKRLQHS